MSRQAKTIRQHLLEGTVPQGKPDKPSSFVGGRPRIPSHLCPVARSEFKRVVQLLERRRTVTPGDIAAISVYSEVYARWVQAKREIGSDLMVEAQITDNNGTLRTVSRLNPLLKVVEGCESRMLAFIKSLGLTPVDRERAKATAPNPDGDEPVPGTIAWYERQEKDAPALEIIPPPAEGEDE